MIIRPMTEEDVEAVFLLEQECFPDPWSRKSIKGTLREEKSYLLVAEENGKICGYLNSTYILDEMNLNRIAISKDFRRRNIGYSLLSDMINFCKNNGIKRVMLEVRVSNFPAQNLYKAFGFTVLGERKNFYSNPIEAGLIMEKVMEE